MTVFTNKPQKYTDFILKELEVDHLFLKVIGSYAEYPMKPDSKGTLALFDVMQLHACDVLMVGDTDVDLHTGQQVGMDVALVDYGYWTPEEVQAIADQANYICSRFDELLEIVLTK